MPIDKQIHQFTVRYPSPHIFFCVDSWWCCWLYPFPTKMNLLHLSVSPYLYTYGMIVYLFYNDVDEFHGCWRMDNFKT